MSEESKKILNHIIEYSVWCDEQYHKGLIPEQQYIGRTFAIGNILDFITNEIVDEEGGI